MTGGPGEEHRTNRPPPTGRVQERSKGVQPPPRILLTSIHLGWTRHAPPGKTQNDWLKTTWKLIHHHKIPMGLDISPRLRWATWQRGLPGFPYSPALCPEPFPSEISCFVSTCVSSDNSFPSVRQKPTLRPWKGSPFLQQDNLNYYLNNLQHQIYFSESLSCIRPSTDTLILLSTKQWLTVLFHNRVNRANILPPSLIMTVWLVLDRKKTKLEDFLVLWINPWIDYQDIFFFNPYD